MSSNFSPGDPGHVGEHNRVYDEIGALEDSVTALDGAVDVDTTVSAAIDSGATSAVADHEAEADPHPQYVGQQAVDDATSGLASEDYAVPRSLVDAAGDLIVGTGPDTVARLAKGADGTVLGVSGGSLGFVSSGGGDVVLETTVNVTSAVVSLDVSGLDLSAYAAARLVGVFRFTPSYNRRLIMSFNNDTGTGYYRSQAADLESMTSSSTVYAGGGFLSQDVAYGCMIDTLIDLDLLSALTTYRGVVASSYSNDLGVSGFRYTGSTHPLTSFQLFTSNSNTEIDAGSWLKLYGLK